MTHATLPSPFLQPIHGSFGVSSFDAIWMHDYCEPILMRGIRPLTLVFSILVFPPEFSVSSGCESADVMVYVLTALMESMVIESIRDRMASNVHESADVRSFQCFHFGFSHCLNISMIC